jgi:hypothetical protein
MTEPPTYTVATNFDEIKQLREVIDALRANNAGGRDAAET